MPRRANTLIAFSLAAGLCYGRFILPWALAPDPRDALEELSELIRTRLDKAANLNSSFPDGVAYDFGKVERGILPYHAFRIVNTSDAPLRIISLRKS